MEENLGIKLVLPSWVSANVLLLRCSSQADNDEAYMAGEAAVRAAISGETDKMVTLIRGDEDQYTCRLVLLRSKISQTA